MEKKKNRQKKDDEEMLLDELDRLEHLEELEITLKSVHNLERLNMKSPKLLTAICLQDLKGSKSINICLLRDMKYLSNITVRNSDLEEIHYAAAVGSISSSSSLHMETVMSFSYVRMVTVTRCNYLKDLTIMLVLLPNLTTLEVESCYRMEEMISAEQVVDLKNVKLFSKLSRVYLMDLPALRCIYRNPLPFPLLRNLTVQYCPLLKKLPLDSRSRDGPKINLTAMEEWWEAIEWKDGATKAVLLPRFKCDFLY